MIQPNEFKCHHCGGVFEKGCTDEEATQEYVENFGQVVATHDDGYVVCDDCYNEIMKKFTPEQIQKCKESYLNQAGN
jgi:hypothetical protein